MLDPTILKGVGILIGGILGGIISAKKLPMTRNDSRNSTKVPISKETGGNMHISMEALSKFNRLNDRIDEDFLTKDKHHDLCTIASLETKAYIKRKIEESTTTIVAAIKDNGK